MKAAILTDTTKCNNCHECVAACKKQNLLTADMPRRWDLDDGLSAKNWTSVVEGPQHAFVRKQCRHCLEPACASACPVGALHQTKFGAVVYETSKCMGCRYYMMACPYGIPRYEWEAQSYVRKCISATTGLWRVASLHAPRRVRKKRPSSETAISFWRRRMTG